MDNKQTIANWIESTDMAIDALREWRRNLEEWRRIGCGVPHGEFHAALYALRVAGLEDWADRNVADLDGLARAVTR